MSTKESFKQAGLFGSEPNVELDSGKLAYEAILAEAADFARQWIKDKHGSAAEFVAALEGEFGYGIRVMVADVIGAIQGMVDLRWEEEDYIAATINEERLDDALGAKPAKKRADMPSLDELFSRSTALRSSAKFAEAINFVSKFRKYSPFNNMLVYLQNPNATFWALPRHWEQNFRRTVKDDARPMIILAPMTPVLLVYDVDDTEGDPLPKWFSEHFTVQGEFSPTAFEKTIGNCGRDNIQVIKKKLSFIHGGSAIRSADRGPWKMTIELNADFDSKTNYATLCHELAHIHLGHLGSDTDAWWPSRPFLTRNQREIEAEAVSYIVCRRAGLITQSDEYLTGYISSPNDLTRISIDLITKVAGLIEQMGEKNMPERKPKGQR